jgi:hypothetical protein
MAKDSALMTWSTIVIEGAQKLGIDLTMPDRMLQTLESTGFEDGESSICAWPIGVWPKEKERKRLGVQLQSYWLEALEAFAWRPFCEMKWDKKEIEDLLAKAKNEIYNSQIRASMHIRTFWARKPRVF